MLLFRLEELDSIRTYFQCDLPQVLKSAWLKLVKDENVTDISQLSEGETGRQLLNYNLARTLFFPFSTYFFQRAETFRDLFIREHRDCEQQLLDEIVDEDELQDNIEALKVRYYAHIQGRVEQMEEAWFIENTVVYFKDFCSLMNLGANLPDRFQNLQMLFQRHDKAVTGSPMALHVGYWCYGDKIEQELRMISTVAASIEADDEKSTFVETMLRQEDVGTGHLLEAVCKHYIQQIRTSDPTVSVSSWHQSVYKVISDYPSSTPVVAFQLLRLCEEFVRLICIDQNQYEWPAELCELVNASPAADMSDFFSCQQCFLSVWDLVVNIETRETAAAAPLQRFRLEFAHRSLSELQRANSTKIQHILQRLLLSPGFHSQQGDGAGEPETTTALPPRGIQLWIKAHKTMSVIAGDGPDTTIAQIRLQVASELQIDADSYRLIFAGRELEDELSLASYNLANESELHLILRVKDDDPVDLEAEQETDAMRTMMRGKKLGDFQGFRKIGGKDIQAGPGQGYSQSGVCSYVYHCSLRGDSTELALKVMLNYDTAHDTVALSGEFDAETALLSDPERLPPHRHIMSVLHSFADEATTLPEWNFEPDIVMARTMMVVMPFYEKDLKAALNSCRRRGEEFSDLRAARISHHLLLAVRHLKTHGIAHRDIKPDNILLANVDTEEEIAVLTDFGMCFDFRKNHVEDCQVEMKFDGFRRGGAPIALAPEITLPQPGPGVVLDYSKNDEWAVGMVAYEMFVRGFDGCVPFEDMEHPATYTDDGYDDEAIADCAKPLVRSLLRVKVADRLSAVEGVHQTKQLLTLCSLDTGDDIKPQAEPEPAGDVSDEAEAEESEPESTALPFLNRVMDDFLRAEEFDAIDVLVGEDLPTERLKVLDNCLGQAEKVVGRPDTFASTMVMDVFEDAIFAPESWLEMDLSDVIDWIRNAASKLTLSALPLHRIAAAAFLRTLIRQLLQSSILDDETQSIVDAMNEVLDKDTSMSESLRLYYLKQYRLTNQLSIPDLRNLCMEDSQKRAMPWLDRLAWTETKNTDPGLGFNPFMHCEQFAAAHDAIRKYVDEQNEQRFDAFLNNSIGQSIRAVNHRVALLSALVTCFVFPSETRQLNEREGRAQARLTAVALDKRGKAKGFEPIFRNTMHSILSCRLFTVLGINPFGLDRSAEDRLQSCVIMHAVIVVASMSASKSSLTTYATKPSTVKRHYVLSMPDSSTTWTGSLSHSTGRMGQSGQGTPRDAETSRRFAGAPQEDSLVANYCLRNGISQRSKYFRYTCSSCGFVCMMGKCGSTMQVSKCPSCHNAGQTAPESQPLPGLLTQPGVNMDRAVHQQTGFIEMVNDGGGQPTRKRIRSMLPATACILQAVVHICFGISLDLTNGAAADDLIVGKDSAKVSSYCETRARSCLHELKMLLNDSSYEDTALCLHSIIAELPVFCSRQDRLLETPGQRRKWEEAFQGQVVHPKVGVHLVCAARKFRAGVLKTDETISGCANDPLAMRLAEMDCPELHLCRQSAPRFFRMRTELSFDALSSQFEHDGEASRRFTYLRLFFEYEQQLSGASYKQKTHSEDVSSNILPLVQWTNLVSDRLGHNIDRAQASKLTVEQFLTKSFSGREVAAARQTFNNFMQSWNALRRRRFLLSTYVQDEPLLVDERTQRELMPNMTEHMPIEWSCLCVGSSVHLVIQKLAGMQNEYIGKAMLAAAQPNCSSTMSFFNSAADNAPASSSEPAGTRTSVCEIRKAQHLVRDEIVEYERRNDYVLQTGESCLEYGNGKEVQFDFSRLELLLAKNYLFGCVHIDADVDALVPFPFSETGSSDPYSVLEDLSTKVEQEPIAPASIASILNHQLMANPERKTKVLDALLVVAQSLLRQYNDGDTPDKSILLVEHVQEWMKHQIDESVLESFEGTFIASLPVANLVALHDDIEREMSQTTIDIGTKAKYKELLTIEAKEQLNIAVGADPVHGLGAASADAELVSIHDLVKMLRRFTVRYLNKEDSYDPKMPLAMFIARRNMWPACNFKMRMDAPIPDTADGDDTVTDPASHWGRWADLVDLERDGHDLAQNEHAPLGKALLVEHTYEALEHLNQLLLDRATNEANDSAMAGGTTAGAAGGTNVTVSRTKAQAGRARAQNRKRRARGFKD